MKGQQTPPAPAPGKCTSRQAFVGIELRLAASAIQASLRVPCESQRLFPAVDDDVTHLGDDEWIVAVVLQFCSGRPAGGRGWGLPAGRIAK